MIVIDANMVFAALLKEGKTREIVVSNKFEFASPEYLDIELKHYRKEIVGRSGVTDGEIEVLIRLLLDKIRIVPYKSYKDYLVEAQKIMERDIDDAPYVACYLALGCEGIWTNDLDYTGKDRIQVIRTEELIKFL